MNVFELGTWQGLFSSIQTSLKLLVNSNQFELVGNLNTLVHILTKMASSQEVPFPSDVARTRSRSLSPHVADLYYKLVFELRDLACYRKDH